MFQKFCFQFSSDFSLDSLISQNCVYFRASVKFPAFLPLPGAVHRSIARNMATQPAAWVWAYLLQMALLILGLHQLYAASYLDPEAPQSHLCPWIQGKLQLLRERNSTTLLISLPFILNLMPWQIFLTFHTCTITFLTKSGNVFST